MKKLSMLAAGILVSTVGFSQISVDPEVGINISNMRAKVGEQDASTNDAAIGLRAGAGVHISLYKGLYLRPGLYYNMLGDKLETGEIKTANTLHYLQLPVNLGYRYAISPKAGAIFAEAGPYVGYALAGKYKMEGLPGGTVKEDIKFGDKAQETNPLDWGFTFGVGYESPWGIYAKGSYGLGLGNMSNIDDTKHTHNAWNVSLGYRIKL